MDKKKSKTPVLRFPGFDGEWDECELGRVINLKRGYDLPKRSRVDGNVPIISSSGIAGFHNEEKVKGPGIVTGRYGTIGSVFYLKENFWPLNTSLYVQDFKGNYIKFVYFLLGNFDFGIFSDKSAVPGINRNHVHEAQISIPTLPEQQKIAGFLTAVEDEINQLTRKKTLLEKYKKGVMQKIFSQEIRFKDDEGKDFPEWEVKRLDDVGILVIDGDRGTNYPHSDDFSEGGYCLFLNAKNVTTNGFSFEVKSFITKERDNILNKGKLIRNDLVLTTRGTVGNIAFFNEKVRYEHLRINSGMVVLRNTNILIEPKFIYILFRSPHLIYQIKKISFGSAQQQLTVREINKFKVSLPSLPEQQKIADFLSGIDKKIEHVDFQLEKTKEWKKGLLQQMFV